MNEIEEFKNFLGPIAKDFTDAQLPQLRREMYAMAELLLDCYLSKKNVGAPKREHGLDSSNGDASLRDDPARNL